MVSLIKNEFIKIFGKKSTYIVLIVLALFVVLTSCIYKFVGGAVGGENYITSEQYIKYVREELNNIDVNSNREEYIGLQTDLDFYELCKKYDKNSWQLFIVERDFYEYLHNINLAKYGTQADKEGLTDNPEEVYKNALEKLEKSDWKQYVEEEIKATEAELASVKEEKKSLEETSNTKQVDEMIKSLETKLELDKMRIEKDIPYGKNYMNDAIDTVLNLSSIDNDYNDQSMSYQDKVAKQKQIEDLEKAKYIIENKQDINNVKSVRGGILNLFDDYSIFLVIFVVMIAGGMISSEMEKGTIKLLLVKPYKRWKILLAKYIVSICMTLFILAVTILLEIIIGGIIFGFDSLSIPAVVYNFKTNSLQTYNIFAYTLIIAINKLPIYLLLGTLAFAVSCIFGNTVLAVVLPIIGNIGGSIVKSLLNIYPVKQLAIFPTLNWDFTDFLFGKLPGYEFTNREFAIGVCIMYWVIMIIASFIAFRKKEIKNI